LAGNDCTTECRIEEILLRQSPGKYFTICKEPIGYRIFDIVCARDQINVVHNDGALELINTADEMRIHTRFDDVPPSAEIALDFRPNETGTVLQRKSVQRVARRQQRLTGMRVSRFAKTKTLGPI